MSQMINIDETLKTIQQIMNANLSPRAKNLGIWIAVNRGIKSSEPFWVKQAILAQDLNCSKSSIGRALRQLVNAKLLMDINQRHKGRYKFYRLNTELAQSPLVDRFLKEAGERWERLFPALDGKSGRPALASCLNNLIHRHMKRTESKQEIEAQIEAWLKNDADLWMPHYLRDHPVESDFLSKEQHERFERLLQKS
ncbi:MAG: helix-turn-helix domain-containing protein [Myxococcaceae bacterium]